MLVARETGRAVLDVWREPYAVTLYTAVHLEQLREREAWAREAERHDMASLNAMATHDPKKISDVHARFRSRILASPERTARLRMRALAHIEAHKHLVPIDPPTET